METKLINFRVPIAKARKLQAYAAIKNRTVTSVLTQFIDNLELTEAELKEMKEQIEKLGGE